MPRFRPLPVSLAAVLLIALSRPSAAAVRPPDVLDAAQVRQALQTLRVTGSVLYVAAHPDDENTAMLAWLARERKVRTAYLALTRGDGGQNLIGQELGEELGVIRTQELLAARRLDGAEQFFTRAVDFGFSKTPDETFATWGRDSILSDVVRVIRRFRPDVIVTRFATDGSGGHGHHTASAILAEEAFRAAADPRRFPGCGAAWQAKRLMWNAWSPGGVKVDSTWLQFDVGGFNPLLGRSYGEIAAASRSNHKSQGFGVPERHGALPQYLALRTGDPAAHDLLDGVDLSWRREGAAGERLDAAIARAEAGFDPQHPSALLPDLAAIREALDRTNPTSPWRARAEGLYGDLVRSCAALWIEAVALQPTVVPGDSLRVAVTLVNRSDLTVRVTDTGVGVARFASGRDDAALAELPWRNGSARDVPPHGTLVDTFLVGTPRTLPLTQPYWLRQPQVHGRFAVAPGPEIGRPEGLPALTAQVNVIAGGARASAQMPVAYRWTDPVQGERWRALEVAPPATLALEHATYVFPDAAPRDVDVTVQAQRPRLEGSVRLALPPGWTCTPADARVQLARAGESTTLRFVVTPGAGPATATLAASITVDGRAWSHRLERIDYPHIPVQTLYPPAIAPLVRADIRHRGTRAGYVAGSGDAIPDALHQLGYDTTFLTDDAIAHADLSRYDVLVTGVRAFNTRPALLGLKARLLDYVDAGGTLLVQYNTTADGPIGDLGPWPFSISRDRVTVEEAPVRALLPASSVLTTPNALGASDWNGWVQERGLYFANPFDPRYQAPLSCNDPGEPARDGGLLVADHGKGTFEYCAYALFRQLPAGVPGAWRLFANLLSAKPAAATP